MILKNIGTSNIVILEGELEESWYRDYANGCDDFESSLK